MCHYVIFLLPITASQDIVCLFNDIIPVMQSNNLIYCMFIFEYGETNLFQFPGQQINLKCLPNILFILEMKNNNFRTFLKGGVVGIGLY